MSSSHFKYVEWNGIVSETRVFNKRRVKYKTTNIFNGIGSHRADVEWKRRHGTCTRTHVLVLVLVVRCVFLILIISFLFGWWARFVRHEMRTVGNDDQTKGNRIYVISRFHSEKSTISLRMQWREQNVMYLENALAATATPPAHTISQSQDSNNTRQLMHSFVRCNSSWPRQCVFQQFLDPIFFFLARATLETRDTPTTLAPEIQTKKNKWESPWWTTMKLNCATIEA